MATVFQVEKMTCSKCAGRVTKAIQSVESAAQVNIDLPSGKVEVEPSPADPVAIAKLITEAGYPARPVL